MYEVGDEDQFTNDVKMFVPLTIDDLEMESQNYFFSGTKFIIASLSLLPYITIFFFLDYVPNIQIFIVYTILYLIGYSFVLRFAVFEESRQKEQMRELENNKYSDLTYFWQLDKVGTGERDDGMLYIQSDGFTIRRAYIVEVDSGSTIGVPENAYRNYREVWQKFFRMSYQLGFEVKLYNVRKKPELSESLKKYSLQLQDIENEAYRSLMQLNIETNFLYAVSEEQRYVTYIEVINKRVDNLINFKDILQDIIDKTFETDGLFANPKILKKPEVDVMLATYFGQDHVNSRGVHRTNGYKAINEYADVVNIWDSEGKSVPFEIQDFIETESRKGERGARQTIEDLLKQDERDAERWAEKVSETKDRRIRDLQRKRREELISYNEYEEQMRNIEETLNPETATEFDLLDEKAQQSRLISEQREKEKQDKREQRLREREKQNNPDTRKWYEKEEELTLEEMLTEDGDEFEFEIERDVGDISIEDLLGMDDEDNDYI